MSEITISDLHYNTLENAHERKKKFYKSVKNVFSSCGFNIFVSFLSKRNSILNYCIAGLTTAFGLFVILIVIPIGKGESAALIMGIPMILMIVTIYLFGFPWPFYCESTSSFSLDNIEDMNVEDVKHFVIFTLLPSFPAITLILYMTDLLSLIGMMLMTISLVFLFIGSLFLMSVVSFYSLDPEELSEDD